MKFQYIGDNNEPPIKTTCYGYDFVLDGDAVEVEDEFVIEKLKGSKTFRVIGEENSIDSTEEPVATDEPTFTDEPTGEPEATEEPFIPGGVQPDNFGQ